LEIPGEGIVCPFTTTLAYATEALGAGCELIMNAAVTGVRANGGGHEIETERGLVRAEHLVNAAGLRSDEVDAMLGRSQFKVTPRRGELIVFDKLARGLINHVLLPVPTEKTKGVLVSPTIYGNLLLGPTADDVPDKTDRSTTEAGLASLMEAGARILPALERQEVTATYVGLRAATEHRDYQLTAHPDQRYVCAGGIRSTGITGSLAIAEWVREALADAGLDLQSARAQSTLHMPNIGEFGSRPYQEGDRIESDPDCGRIVCFCERVTRSEIDAALASPIPPADADGLRRRTRALMGRCQGFFCGAEVAAALEGGAVNGDR
jgi:glycerol-3-phosphate dehydrogenase